MEDKINISEIKRIINEITISESKKYGVNFDVNPVSFADIIDPNFFINNKYTLMKRISDYKAYKNSNGYNNLKGYAVVFLDRIKGTGIFEEIVKETKYDLIQRYNSITHNDSKYLRRLAEREEGYIVKYCNGYKFDLFQIIKTCYHEIRHSIQANNDRYSYDRFLYDIENFYMKCDLGRDYNDNHDSYSFEIGANLYGIRMAKEYLKNNYPDIYEKKKYIIGVIEMDYKNDYHLYNPSYTIDRVIPWIKIFSLFGINNISPILSIFLNEDGSYKRPIEVINNSKYPKLDKRIVYAFFSSLSFMKELKSMDNLLPEEVNIINEALDYTSDICNIQFNYYNSKVKQIDKPSNFIEQKKLELIYLKSFFAKYKYLKKQLMSLNNSKEQINSRSM